MNVRRVLPVVLLVGIAAVGMWRGSSTVADAQTDPVAAGRDLYVTGCASCHGLDGTGMRDRGPSLIGVGAASADFYLSTGRMPATRSTGQMVRKPPKYSERDIALLVAYVASLGDGPPIPEVEPSTGSLTRGRDLYISNCAACHNAAGSGGAVGQAIYAPSIRPSSAQQVAEAVRIGPGAMPVFDERALDDEALASLLRYVEYLKDPNDRGGLPLGRIGPVPEGLVAWFAAMGSLLVVARWLGARH